MAGEVRRRIGTRIGQRVADARLRTEMDDAIDRLAGQRCIERRMIGEIDFGEAEQSLRARLRRDRRQPVSLERDGVVVVEVIDPDYPLAARDETTADV